MLIGLLGTPSPLTLWTLEVLKALVAAKGANFGFVHASRLSDLRERWDSLDESLREYVILYSETPDPGMTEQLLSDEIPVIVTADDASDVAAYMMAARQLDCHTAIRLTSQCFSTIWETRGKAVLPLRHDQYAERAESFIKKLADFLAFYLDEDEIGEVVARLTENPGASVGQALVQNIPHARLPGTYQIQDPDARTLIQNVLTPYSAFLENKPNGPLIWPRRIFLEGDRQGQYVSGTVALFGIPRCLIYGPYLYLPRGAWSARVEIEVDENYSGNRLRSDVLLNCSKILTGITAPLSTRGVFEYVMNFEYTDPRLPLEIRLINERSGIEGRLLLRVVELTRTGDTADAKIEKETSPTPLRQLQVEDTSHNNVL